jgi:hypothetical protein
MTRKKDLEREKVRQAREKARRAVAYWTHGRFGTQTAVPQGRIRRAMGMDLNDVVQRYPMAIRKERKTNVWDMQALERSLRFDDPVTMIGNLAPADSGTWRSLLESMEREDCTTDQETAIRVALLRMKLPLYGAGDPPDDPWAASWALYRENILKRKV